MKLFRVIKEINNYLFIGKTIKKNKDTDEWKKHNLRIGYFNILYSVINLPPEVYESEEQYYQMYVIEQLKPINEYLASLNLQEVVTLQIESKCNKLDGIYAFGVKYVPLFREFNLWWLFKWIGIICVSAWATSRFDLIDHAKSAFLWTYDSISNFLIKK
jgi:hypothetical protein